MSIVSDGAARVKPGCEPTHYVYTDSRGKPVFRAVCRAGETSYERAEKGKFLKGLRGVPPVPYRLDLVEHSDRAGVVFVADDEAGVDALTGAGLVATCCVQDAAWGHSDWPPFLEGRRVAVVGRSDEKGRDESGNAARYIATAAAEVRVVEPGGLRSAGGVAAWVRDVVSAGLDPAETLRTEFDNADPFGATPAPAEEQESDEELGLTDLSAVEPKELEWLWLDRFPLGKISLVAGEGGIGKSFMTLDMASIVSRGAVWPDAPGVPVTQGDVILLSAEDDLADTVVPRLKAMGANLKRIAALGMARSKNGILRPFTLQEIDRLDRVIAKRPTTRLIVIDPITAYLGPVNDHKNAELRGLLGPLSDFAARHRVAVVCITHFNKTAGGKASARIIGSVAYSNAARATWCVALDPENENRRLLMPVKANLSKSQTSLAYTIADGVIVWEADSFKANVNEILGGTTAPGDDRKKKAIAWLQETLATGGMPSDDVIESARAAGFGKDLIWKVKAEAGVRAKRVGFGSDGVWTWILDATPSTNPIPTTEPMGGNGSLKGLKEPMGGNGKGHRLPKGPKAPKDSDPSQSPPACGGCLRLGCPDCNP